MTDTVEPTAPARPVLPPPPVPLRTERLLLRPARPDDAPDLDYYVDPEVARYLPFAALDPSALPERAVTLASRTAPSEPGDALNLVVEHEGRVVGDVMLRLTGPAPPGASPSIGELGWVFSPSVAGRGFATEAARAMARLGFEHYPLHRLMAQLDPLNTASARICERLGMKHEAHTRRDFLSHDGTWKDTAVYGLLREEWEAERG
ncbi:aminoglycoside 6'-N-acetyltransferase [Nocardioides thalensis]|uniref:Aminoglycoside 6'-N-acetyltransferase n=1 Tax=Nocardioides thalensis TaxID=1914755 RepID=A0A853C666_9ACTN|nr:aminoglycoside 6'-N-acetyltransferase [Nocardioides thalensis]